MAEAARFAHHMSDEDALMWNIEKDPVLRSTIVAGRDLRLRHPTGNACAGASTATTCFIPRLRQRVHVAAVPDRAAALDGRAGFDLDFHLRRMRLAGAGHRCAPLLDALQPIATASFDRARPLWEFTLFEGLDGSTASAPRSR